jgi:hypothetical protein
MTALLYRPAALLACYNLPLLPLLYAYRYVKQLLKEQSDLLGRCLNLYQTNVHIHSMYEEATGSNPKALMLG